MGETPQAASPTPEIYATTSEGIRFYEETAHKYIRDGRLHMLQGFAGSIVIVVLILVGLESVGADTLWGVLLLIPLVGWGVSGTGQWIDGRKYLLKIEALRHYRQRDVREATKLASQKNTTPPQTGRARSNLSDDDDDGEMF